MNNEQLKWTFGEAPILLLLSCILLASGIMKPWNPMPIYLVIVAWIGHILFMFVVPLAYLIEMKLLSRSKNYLKFILGISERIVV